MRKTKREIIAYDAAGDSDYFTAASVKLRRQKNEYGAFSKATGLRTQTDRAGVLGYGKSISQKAVWAEKRFTNAQKQDKIISEIKKKLGVKGALSIPAKVIDTKHLTFDDAHINQERQHNVTLEDAINYINTAKASVSVWGGKFERYYSANGFSYVDMEQMLIRTAFSKSEFDDKAKLILEVLNTYGL